VSSASAQSPAASAPGPARSGRGTRRASSSSRGPEPGLALLRGFELRLGDRLLTLPLSAQRVMAFLALHDRPLQRVYVAGNLWLDTSEEHANASLRTALWRLSRAGCPLVDATATHVALASGIAVDVQALTDLARRSVRDEALSEPEDISELCRAGELLPDWYDDWILIERERFRQLRLHALESLCTRLAAVGRFAEAADAGLAAVQGEVLRESAHRAVIAAYIAEGNSVEAIRQYRFFRDLLASELGLEPSPLITELMRPLQVS
jgi:DNA-binding SARP family transcriptional activator